MKIAINYTDHPDTATAAYQLVHPFIENGGHWDLILVFISHPDYDHTLFLDEVAKVSDDTLILGSTTGSIWFKNLTGKGALAIAIQDQASKFSIETTQVSTNSPVSLKSSAQGTSWSITSAVPLTFSSSDTSEAYWVFNSPEKQKSIQFYNRQPLENNLIHLRVSGSLTLKHKLFQPFQGVGPHYRIKTNSGKWTTELETEPIKNWLANLFSQEVLTSSVFSWPKHYLIQGFPPAQQPAFSRVVEYQQLQGIEIYPPLPQGSSFRLGIASSTTIETAIKEIVSPLDASETNKQPELLIIGLPQAVNTSLGPELNTTLKRIEDLNFPFPVVVIENHGGYMSTNSPGYQEGSITSVYFYS